MEQPNKSEEELEEVAEQPETPEGEGEETEEAEVTEEPKTEGEEPTVLLSEHTRTKDVLHRVADMILNDPDKMNGLIQEDPKLFERIKKEFPKKFKDISVPVPGVASKEEIEAIVKSAVAAQLKSSGKSETLDGFREELGMTKLEFEDIKDELSSKADHLLSLEMADSYKEAVLQAYKNLSPKKYKEFMEKEAVKGVSKRKSNSKSGSGGAGEVKQYSKSVLDNYKKLGFKDPEEMVKYQNGGGLNISEYVKSKR